MGGAFSSRKGNARIIDDDAAYQMNKGSKQEDAKTQHHEPASSSRTSPDYTPVRPFDNNKWSITSLTGRGESGHMGNSSISKRAPSNKVMPHVDGPDTPDDNRGAANTKGSPMGTPAASLGPSGFLRAPRPPIPGAAEDSNERLMPEHGDALSGEELYAIGFRIYSIDNIEASSTSSLKQAIAYVILDAGKTREQSSSGSRRLAEQTSWIHRRGEKRNRLMPVYANEYCLKYFKIDNAASYISVIKKLLKRDPLLTFALQKAVRHLKAGDSSPVTHVTPDPSGQSSALYGLRLTPCLWKGRDGRLQPTLMMEHNVAYNPAEVMPRLMRDYAVLSHVPAILTLIDFEGKVLYQNASSLEYMGDLLSAKYDNQLSDGLLHVLFTYDQTSLEDMLDNVLSGAEWQGVVLVPYSLMRYLGVQQHADTIIDFAKADDQSSSKPFKEIEPYEEEEFHIGETRAAARKRQSVAFFMKQQGVIAGSGSDLGDMSRKHGSGRNVFEMQTHGEGAGPSPLSGPVARMSAAGGDDGTHPLLSSSGRTSMSVSMSGGVGDLALGSPSLANRKFMTLISTKGAPAPSPLSLLQKEMTAPNLTIGEDSVKHLSRSGRHEADVESEANDDDHEEEVDEEEIECYHEVHAIPLLDPVLDKQVVMLVQTDVTPRVELENKLADLTDAQLSMLEQLFPRHIIEYMLARLPTNVGKNIKGLANNHEKVMVLFCDVVGFTSMSKEVEPSAVMNFLNELYEIFDNLSDDYNMYKLDIVGDCYIVVAGLIKEDQDGFVCVDDLDEDQVASNAIRIMQFAKAMLRHSKPIVMPHNQSPVQIRIGIHTGPLVSGLVGSKMPKFTLFGDTMNTASRMESTCKPGCIQVSDAFKSLVPHEEWEATGGVQVKGKGLMETFIFTPSKKQELLDLEAVVSKAPSRRMDKSFTSANSRTTRSNSAHRRGSDSGRSHAGGFKSHETTNNPLMTILTNLRAGVDDEGDAERAVAGQSGDGGGGGGRMRPKSAYHRKSMAVYNNSKYNRDSSLVQQTEDVDEAHRRSGLSETMHQNLRNMLPGASTSFKNAEGNASAGTSTMNRTKSNRHSRTSKPVTTFSTLDGVFSSRPAGSTLETVYDKASSKGDATSSKEARSSVGASCSMGRSGASASSMMPGSSLPSARSMGSMGRIAEQRRDEEDEDHLAVGIELDENGNEVLLLA